MINPAIPRLTIFFAYPVHSDISFFRKNRTFNSAFPVRKKRTKAADNVCDSMVAIAAPRTPNPRTKINSGSSIRFATAPIATESIPTTEYPWALMNGFIPTAIIDGNVPSR